MPDNSKSRRGRRPRTTAEGTHSDLYQLITPESDVTEKIGGQVEQVAAPKKKPGRPRKNPDAPAQPKSGAPAKASAEAAQKPSEGKRRPGRPPKQKTSAESAQNAKASIQPESAPKKKPGRPRKDAAQQAQPALPAAQTARKPSAGKKKAAVIPTKTGFPPVRVIFLGGINEIGKNMTAYECGNDIILVDCGTSFPDDDMLGIDLVIPDYTYLEKNRDKIRGVLITHGHEDHIGGLPYFLREINCPVYATRLTIGLIANKLREHGLLEKAKLNVVKERDVVKLGCFTAEFIHVNHSIPDAVAIAITTPAGVIVQTGDFKIDYTPISGGIIDIARLSELGDQGVLALLCDSTNAERPGATQSERTVGESFVNLFNRAGNRRIIIATFSSNIHRIQQVIDLAEKLGRKVCISGRSMINVTTTAIELGYLRVPEGLLIDIDSIHRYTPDKLIVVTTGSQGEPMSALYRMAMSDHRKLSVGPNDFIIISANPIPGNEKLVSRVVNELMKQGAEVIYESMYEVHVSGHACRDELRTMHALTRPEYFIPVHGEFKHLKKHAQLALDMGMEPDHVFIPDIGKVVEFTDKGVNMNATVPAGRVLVDGLGVGDVGSIVLRDRKHLGQDGLIVITVAMESETGTLVSGPDITSRGFVYVREAESLMDEAERVVKQALVDCQNRHMRDWNGIRNYVKDQLSTFIYHKTKRSPMILMTIMPV